MPLLSKTLVGPGRFQWNAGAWFGSTFGCCAWMLVASCFLVIHDEAPLASVPAIGFAAVWLAAIALWTRRGRIFPFTALMILLGVLAGVLPVVWIIVSTWASVESLAEMNWPRATGTAVLASAGAPLLMAWCWLLERSATRDRLSCAQQSEKR